MKISTKILMGVLAGSCLFAMACGDDPCTPKCDGKVQITCDKNGKEMRKTCTEGCDTKTNKCKVEKSQTPPKPDTDTDKGKDKDKDKGTDKDETDNGKTRDIPELNTGCTREGAKMYCQDDSTVVRCWGESAQSKEGKWTAKPCKTGQKCVKTGEGSVGKCQSGGSDVKGERPECNDSNTGKIICANDKSGTVKCGQTRAEDNFRPCDAGKTCGQDGEMFKCIGGEHQNGATSDKVVPMTVGATCDGTEKAACSPDHTKGYYCGYKDRQKGERAVKERNCTECKLTNKGWLDDKACPKPTH